MRQRTPRERDEAHLKFICSLPCLVCGDDTSVEAAHIRFTDLSVAKDNPGVGQKPHDYWTIPLCGQHHREQHNMKRKGFLVRPRCSQGGGLPLLGDRQPRARLLDLARGNEIG